ncbi:MAG TPA: KH domain-containing protein [Polyangiaceae bacterium]|nr:KH domain-containing protein [Polyangiaceae bacterium]
MDSKAPENGSVNEAEDALRKGDEGGFDEDEGDEGGEAAKASPAGKAQGAAAQGSGPRAVSPVSPVSPVPLDASSAPSAPFVEDGRADEALDFVIDVLAAMGMDCTVDLLENDEEDPPEEIRLEIEGRDAGRIIGKKGQTLMALQFLSNRVINRPGKKRRHVIIDAEGYRARREDSLSSMARRLGRQAVEEGKIITFEPMNPQDRRVVHLALAKFPGVVTKSDGECEARRGQIIPVRR